MKQANTSIIWTIPVGRIGGDRGARCMVYLLLLARRRPAPDFARTVDIHRKPGYDPAELFLDPALSLPKAKIAWILLRRKLGMRPLMEVIPLNAELVRGSHGRPPLSPAQGPLLMTSEPDLVPLASNLQATEVHGVILRHLDLERGDPRQKV